MSIVDPSARTRGTFTCLRGTIRDVKAAVALVGAVVAVACGEAERGESSWAESTVSVTVTDGGEGESAGDDESDVSSHGADDEGSSEGAGSTTGVVEPEDLSNVALLSKPAGIVDLGNGAWQIDEAGLAAIGHAFYAEYGDDYDFLAVYTEGEMLEVYAFAYSVQYDVGGIGFDGYDPGITPATVGSAGKLLQIDMMNAPRIYDDPNDASILVHEMVHHWAAFIEVPGTPAQAFLLDDSWAHWNVHVHTGGPSAVGYGDLVDLGGNRFQFTVQYPLALSPLELYLAGMIPAAEVPPLFYVRDAYDYEPATPPFGGAWAPSSYSMDAAFSGTRVDFTIDDVIAANGPRTPAYGAAKTDFRVAFVLVCTDAAACSPSDVAIVESQRQALEGWFGPATGGRGTVDATL